MLKILIFLLEAEHIDAYHWWEINMAYFLKEACMILLSGFYSVSFSITKSLLLAITLRSQVTQRFVKSFNLLLQGVPELLFSIY